MSEIQNNEETYSVAELMDLLGRAFPEDDHQDPALGIDDDTVIAPNLAALLASPDTVISTATREGALAGLSVAVSIGAMDPARQSESQDTAYVYYTAVEPSLQGTGVVGEVMHNLIAQLRQRGYSYLERDSMISNGYADKVQKTYLHALTEAPYDHDKWGIGPERHFRIDLNLIDNV